MSLNLTNACHSFAFSKLAYGGGTFIYSQSVPMAGTNHHDGITTKHPKACKQRTERNLSDQNEPQ
jgi:hypothetical protein